MKYLDINVTNHLPKITSSYLKNEDLVQSFFNRFCSIENFDKQIKEKKSNYNDNYRLVLKDVLVEQYSKIKNKSLQTKLIKSLSEKNTYTITTGHQLNLFTGPLYFFYKIIDTIKICDELVKKFPNNKFVPVFWMASEDHDFDEINNFKNSQKKFTWNMKSNGKVGEISTSSLKDTFQDLKHFFGDKNLNSKKIIDLFENSYIKNKNLSIATFELVHKLFGNYGLLILNPDNKKLKELLLKDFIDEITCQTCFKKVKVTNDKISSLGFKVQVNPRKINLFYTEKNKRDRIEKFGEKYKILNDGKIFSKDQIVNEIIKYPEKFSPNVLFRTYFQEKILPNLAYVGGGSEIAYWLQLKNYFQERKITFPILKIRSSVLIIRKKEEKKCKKIGVEVSDLFSDFSELSTNLIKRLNSDSLDLSKMKKILNQNFNELHELSEKIDKSFIGALRAQEKKQIKGLEKLEKRIVKAIKKDNKDKLDRLKKLQEHLFPNKNLQEREINFTEFFKDTGFQFVDILYKHINPFNLKFSVIRI